MTDTASAGVTTKQVRLFHTFGFLHLPGALADTGRAPRFTFGRDGCTRLARALLGGEVACRDGGGRLDDCASQWERRAQRPGSLVLTFRTQSRGRPQGELRFLPGTHRRSTGWDGHLGELADPVTGLGLTDREVPCCVVRMAPGDLVAYDPYTLHAAYDSTEGERLSLLYEPTESEGGTR
ncbi:hypothetical protein QFZ66_002453 [Streptomyces sp. B4I13]|uniref:hypothetical protein n=1 Tax=Streptomyces sp. B4I13 TaxID=3042271 RepID=UPI002784F28B|nr:hypothetical protein [Streptomyces sp. B4I13]MDQ0958575.1 hypothetical protein [Streptomyces sp. B4I13]